jgi:ribonuclease HI
LVKQLGLFNDTSAPLPKQQQEPIQWTLSVDGASRNNPGPSGGGFYIEKNGILFIKDGYYLGKKTNNQAEYLALLLGLFVLSEHVQKNEAIHIISDSQLLVRQLSGIYKVKEPSLQKLHAICKARMHLLGATIAHVLRDQNTQADAMANHGVDSKNFPPKHYIALLKNYDIVL